MNVKKESLRNDFRGCPVRLFPMLMFFLMLVFCLKSTPAHADVWGEAQEISTGTIIQDRLPQMQDKYYAFTLGEQGMLTIDFSHSFIDRSDGYWTLKLYNRTYDEIAAYEYVGDKVDASSAQLGVAPGKYYIQISYGSYYSEASYWFTVNYQKTDSWETEFNEKWEEATPLTLGKTMNGSLRALNDWDFYSFTPSSAGALTLTFTHPRIDYSDIYWRMSLYDDEYEQLAEWEIPGNQTKFVVPTIGIGKEKYYLEVLCGNAYSELSYSLNAGFSASALWESELNETRETADKVVISKTYSGNLMGNGDEDYYIFTVNKGGNYLFDFSHSALAFSDSYWQFGIEDSQYNDVIAGEEIAGDKTSYSKALGYLAPGKYWLRIRSGTRYSDGTYTFRISHEGAQTKLSQSISVKNQKKVYGAKAFNLNAKLVIGNGKLKYASSKKKVAVINSKGKITIKGIGKTTITVSATATKEYNAAVRKITLTVLPRPTKIKALSNSKKKKLTIAWRKDSKVNGYIIQYARNKNFKNATTIKITNRKKGVRTISVKKGKTYYIRIRTYKGSLKSSWSKVYKKKITK